MTESIDAVRFDNGAGTQFSTSIRYERVTPSEESGDWLCTIFIEDSENRTLAAKQITLPIGDKTHMLGIRLRGSFWATFQEAVERLVAWQLPDAEIVEAERPVTNPDAIQALHIRQAEMDARESLAEELKNLILERGFVILEPDPGE